MGSKITQLTENTTPVATDQLEMVDDPAGTPLNQKVSFANATKGLSVMTGDAGSGGAKGLVPAPVTGDAAKFLKGDGTWAAPGTSGTPFEYAVAVSDETTALTTGTAKISFYFPVAVNITGVSIGLSAQSTSGVVTADVNKNGSTIFSTNPSVDANENTSHTGTAAVLSTSPTAFSVTDKVTVDIDAAGTGAKGLKVSFTGTRQ